MRKIFDWLRDLKKTDKKNLVVLDDLASELGKPSFKWLLERVTKMRNRRHENAWLWYTAQNFTSNSSGKIPTTLRSQTKCWLVFGGALSERDKMLKQGVPISRGKWAPKQASQAFQCAVKGSP